jgi:nucleoside-diphosphate-sugar epimerase
MVQRVLVTGSGGIVGSHVVNALQSRGEAIEIVCFYGDLTDSINTKAFINEAGKLDTVIHLAAKVALDKVKKIPRMHIW